MRLSIISFCAVPYKNSLFPSMYIHTIILFSDNCTYSFKTLSQDGCHSGCHAIIVSYKISTIRKLPDLFTKIITDIDIINVIVIDNSE